MTTFLTALFVIAAIGAISIEVWYARLLRILVKEQREYIAALGSQVDAYREYIKARDMLVDALRREIEVRVAQSAAQQRLIDSLRRTSNDEPVPTLQ